MDQIEDNNKISIENFIDWDYFEATSNASKRINGVTKEAVLQEVELWEKQIQILESLDYKKICQEIDTWQIEVPSVASLTFENIAATYSRLVSYKLRISYWLSIAKTWRDTADTACKYLEDLAPGAYTGTAVDKKANAMYIIQPFVHLRVQASRIENYLDKMHSVILFCATQLDLLIKEKQSQAKLNLKLANEGEYYSAQNLNTLEVSQVSEENGEQWMTFGKKSNKFS